jgi:uncharacterized lipoprotein YmbA
MTLSLPRVLTLVGVALLLWGCGTFRLPTIYALGEPGRPTPGVIDETGLPHIELPTVTVPDDLDTTDIIRRTASNTVTPSATGVWNERLSLGITRALTTDLTGRLPNMVIDSRAGYEPSRRLLVDIERFEIGADGQCTLTARWRVTAAGDKRQPNSEQGTFVETSTSRTDAAEALAMTSAIDQLASQIALTVKVSR